MARISATSKLGEDTTSKLDFRQSTNSVAKNSSNSVDWNWRVVPGFRGNSAQDFYDNNPESRITTKYFNHLIDDLSPHGIKNMIFDETRLMEYKQKALDEIIMILRNNIDFDINQPAYRYGTCYMDNGAPIDVATCGRTPLDMAISEVGHVELIKLLVNHGAKVNLEHVILAIYKPKVFEYLIQQHPVCFEDETTFSQIFDKITLSLGRNVRDEQLLLTNKELLTQYRDEHLGHLKSPTQ